jgi:hypothetical protein
MTEIESLREEVQRWRRLAAVDMALREHLATCKGCRTDEPCEEADRLFSERVRQLGDLLSTLPPGWLADESPLSGRASKSSEEMR